MTDIRIYTVTGMGPAGVPIEVSIVATSSIDARRKAHEAGMTRIVVNTYREASMSDAKRTDDAPKG